MFHGKSHYKWQFSIAMLVYQRVYDWIHRLGNKWWICFDQIASLGPPGSRDFVLRNVHTKRFREQRPATTLKLLEPFPSLDHFQGTTDPTDPQFF